MPQVLNHRNFIDKNGVDEGVRLMGSGKKASLQDSAA